MTGGPIFNFALIVSHTFSQIVYAEVCLPFILTFPVVKIPGWARKAPTLKTYFTKTIQFYKRFGRCIRLSNPFIHIYPPGNMLRHTKIDHFISRTWKILTFFPDRESKMGYPWFPERERPPIVKRIDRFATWYHIKRWRFWTIGPADFWY